jgi:hypothetical protein
LSQEQVPSLLIQHLPNRLRFTLQQKNSKSGTAIQSYNFKKVQLTFKQATKFPNENIYITLS